MHKPIDFVVTWVDDSDPKWQEEKRRYRGDEGNSQDNVGVTRYRNWGLMPYWFRGVEKFAPWVNKVYFVTCGQRPAWLNVNHPKLVCVDHRDYMPAEALPVFNSNAIELNMHQIPGLSDDFVYFNDDFFIIGPLREADFFRDGVPCDFAALDILTPTDDFGYIWLNMMLVINRHFDKRRVLKEHFGKWYNLGDPKSLMRTLALSYPWDRFSAIRDYHIPTAYTKADFERVWAAIPEELRATQRHRFRSKEDLGPQLMRFWRLAEGRFCPSSRRAFGFMPLMNDNCGQICDIVENQKKRILCINDEYAGTDFEGTKARLLAAFDRILPEKSAFER
ncbi:MAG: Stealth CR1 domain-containing protein [Clostridia bacterium]|nr:Stealth CR1 domain-containing protein [Clostridia bacterium]